MGSKKDGEWNYDAQVSANETNKSIADENLVYQREALAQQSQWNEYQKALNEKIMQREDTAIQRQVADARAAGISPLAAGNVGQAVTGSSLATDNAQTGVLNNQFEAKPASKAQDIASRMQILMNLSDSIGQMAKTVDALQSSSLERANMRLQQQYLESTMNDRINASKYDTLTKYNYLYDTAKERDYNERFGLTRNMSEKERLVRLGLGALFGSEKMVSKNVGTLGANGIGDSVTFSNPRQVSRDDLVQFFNSVGLPAAKTFDSLSNVQGKVADEMSKTVDKVLDNLSEPKSLADKVKQGFDDIQYDRKHSNTRDGNNRYQGNKKAAAKGVQTGGR